MQPLIRPILYFILANRTILAFWDKLRTAGKQRCIIVVEKVVFDDAKGRVACQQRAREAGRR
jgi:hypothetical protein